MGRVCYSEEMARGINRAERPWREEGPQPRSGWRGWARQP